MGDPIVDKLWSRTVIDPDSGCWVWQGCLSHGYGEMRAEGRMQRVHRLAYKRLVQDDIPSGLVIDHVRARGCTSKACWNPDHLEAVPQRENVARGSSHVARLIREPRTHCKWGHELRRRESGRSYCPTCKDERIACPSCGKDVARSRMARHRRSAACAAEVTA